LYLGLIVYSVAASTICLSYMLYELVLYRLSFRWDSLGLWMEWLEREDQWGRTSSLIRLIPNPFHKEMK
jgi:hypothetical protein